MAANKYKMVPYTELRTHKIRCAIDDLHGNIDDMVLKLACACYE